MNSFEGFLEVDNSPIVKALKESQKRSPLMKALRRLSKGGKEAPQKNTTSSKQNSQQFALEGAIQAGTNSPFSINGKDFSITDDTWVVGDLEIGAYASVRGPLKGGKRVATKVVIYRK